ncbi:unnamed protein product [Toxocara canis]|uniref:Uncharacterized protein n=1 Tax=Toxocara canis TaxID=6265 RepID=A0A183URH6_TOXCA|nr:unnamed protein product [Toxocara canis]
MHKREGSDFEVDGVGLESADLADTSPAHRNSPLHTVNKRAILRLGKRALMRLGKRAMMRLGKRAPMRLG